MRGRGGVTAQDTIGGSTRLSVAGCDAWPVSRGDAAPRRRCRGGGTKLERGYSGLDVSDISAPGTTGAIDPLLRVRASESSDPVAELFRLHHRRLMGLAAAVTLDRSVADEVVQEAFAGLASRFETVERPEAYLQRSVINTAIHLVRQRERARAVPVRPVRHSSIPEIDDAWELVAELPAQQRAVVVLRFWEDLPQEQIASVLEIPIGTVKSTLHRALRTLKSNWPTGTEEDR